ncbi:Vitamin K-dependent gamma-carboxylase [Mesonia phycicola]|uniref:Vitamin K-dependent gamma-carboxylase n=1 Tax=Mesonia phycicola TaxID=579105 RepID=A0A1M6FXF5_9FLAO|nr:HTTM domain-containing protein [Mesonia phycicola]SHJ02385.1 Vitamin K-dependent gamma-carboxylase [Mesonia phycicola]
MLQKINAYINTYTNAAPLAFYRMAFGIMMFFSLLRFTLNGWIEKFYIIPQFHFTYYGFSWVKPLGIYTYVIFLLCAISAITVAIGYKYRLSIIIFFLSFTYIELMDKTYYLNHYYFISVVSFVMIFLPANTYFSVDAKQKPNKASKVIPRYGTDILKILIGIVYLYAGIAKLNSDWLFNAMPLKIWLPSKADLPILGALLIKPWVAYAFSWIGALYDLAIVFLLINKRTRIVGFIFVVIFHLLTRLLFPIGVFPFVMIVSSLIFFDPKFHEKILNFLERFLKIIPKKTNLNTSKKQTYFASKIAPSVLIIVVLLQLIIPFRYLLYENELFWTEEGYRFSWRVMLMEKAGYTEFSILDPETGKFKIVDNTKHLTRFQEKQMSFQPDFILEYAHYLYDYYKKNMGMTDPEIKVKSYVSLNGRLSKPYINPHINLAKQDESFKQKTWILPFKDTILGF